MKRPASHSGRKRRRGRGCRDGRPDWPTLTPAIWLVNISPLLFSWKLFFSDRERIDCVLETAAGYGRSKSVRPSANRKRKCGVRRHLDVEKSVSRSQPDPFSGATISGPRTKLQGLPAAQGGNLLAHKGGTESASRRRHGVGIESAARSRQRRRHGVDVEAAAGSRHRGASRRHKAAEGSIEAV